MDSLPLLIRVPVIFAAVVTIIITAAYLTDLLAEWYLDRRT